MERRNFTDENKTEFLELFLNDIPLCQALINNDRNFLDIPITDDQKDALLFDQIFPYKFIPDITISGKSYLTMQFNYTDSKTNDLFFIGDVIIWIFCHRDLIRTKYKYLRYDFMKQRISKILQDKMSNNWFGKIFINPPVETMIDELGKYYGIRMSFSNQILK